MSQKTAVLLANGDLRDPQVVRARLATITPDWVFAADGGARHAPALGLQPDAVIGDLDSLDSRSPVRTLPHPVDKDQTDLELAVAHAAAAGAERIIILGAIGGRLDMTLTNTLLLLHPDLAGRQAFLWNGPETAYLLRPPGGTVDGRRGDRISLIPLAGDAKGVATDGLDFPLLDETLSQGPGRGVSNRLARDSAEVRLASGVLLVVHAPAESGAS